ncbi:cytochrome P450 [Aspergillus karnatakaensis]|uniref:cytochrome P450 n=1 Tax=Aspergillus karnatakaensis TaxID=1810916 RepID=UPI003CCCB376
MANTNLSEVVLSFVGMHPFLILFAAALLGRVLSRRYATSIRDIPGPFVASFSSLWRVYHVWKGHIEEEVIKLHKVHGDFVRIADNEVSVSHPDAVKQLLHANIPKGTFYSVFSLPDYHYVNQMSELDPTRHIHKTRNLSAGFSLTNIQKTESYIDSVLKVFKTQLDELATSGAPVEFQDWFSFFAFDVLGEVTFSKSFGFVQSGVDIRNAIANTGHLVYYISIIGYYVWLHNATLGNPIFSRLGLQPNSHIFDTCLLAIEERKKNPEVRHDMMQRWLDVRASHPERLSEQDIFGAAVANIGAGAETVSATAQAVIYYLLQQPEHLKRVQDELADAERRGELSPLIQYSEVARLPFLQACLKEAYRFHSGVCHSLPRVAPKGGITVAGRYFPEGVILSVHPWVIHRNPEIFGKDCDTYNPNRWLKGDVKKMDAYLIHWGAGYNQCPGRNLAQFELSKVLATVLKDYDIERIDPKKEWQFETRFLAVPYGWPCRIQRKQRA